MKLDKYVKNKNSFLKKKSISTCWYLLQIIYENSVQMIRFIMKKYCLIYF